MHRRLRLSLPLTVLLCLSLGARASEAGTRAPLAPAAAVTPAAAVESVDAGLHRLRAEAAAKVRLLPAATRSLPNASARASQGLLPNLVAIPPEDSPWGVYVSDATPTSFSALPTLTGGNFGAQAYFSCINNVSGSGTVFADVRVLLNGSSVTTLSEMEFLENPASPLVLSTLLPNGAGGRHTVSVEVDPADAVNELFDSDNRIATQWVWSPPVLPFGIPLLQYDVPDPAGALADIPFGDPVWWNVAGVRTPDMTPVGNNGFWSAAGLMSTPTTDYDLDLHTLSTGSQSGFETPIVESNLGPSAPDFILFDLDPSAGGAGQPTQYDLGTRYYSGDLSEPPTLQIVRSQWVFNETGIFTTPVATMSPGQFLALYEIGFGTGLTVRLDNLTGNANLRLHVVRRDQIPASGRISALQLALLGGPAYVDQNGPGGDEIATIGPVASYVAVLVSKSGPTELDKASSFRLSLYNETVSADDAPPSRLRLHEARPNPARSGTAFAFELPRASDATLELVDLAGRRIALLAGGPHAAGRHTATWNGLGADGRAAAPGLYMVRLAAAGETRVSKVAVTR